MPYSVSEVDAPTGCGGLLLPSGRGLFWRRGTLEPAEHRVDSARFFAPVCADDETSRLLGDGWREPSRALDVQLALRMRRLRR